MIQPQLTSLRPELRSNLYVMLSSQQCPQACGQCLLTEGSRQCTSLRSSVNLIHLQYLSTPSISFVKVSLFSHSALMGVIRDKKTAVVVNVCVFIAALCFYLFDRGFVIVSCGKRLDSYSTGNTLDGSCCQSSEVRLVHLILIFLNSLFSFGFEFVRCFFRVLNNIRKPVGNCLQFQMCSSPFHNKLLSSVELFLD